MGIDRDRLFSAAKSMFLADIYGLLCVVLLGSLCWVSYLVFGKIGVFFAAGLGWLALMAVFAIWADKADRRDQ
jgi:hypothetical protein